MPDYYRKASDNLLIMVQVETRSAVKNAGEIARVEGVDLLFLGPSDIAGSLGKLGRTGDPEVEQLIAEARQAISVVGKPLGTVPRQGRTCGQLFDEGFAVLANGSDIFCYYDYLEALARELEDITGKTRG